MRISDWSSDVCSSDLRCSGETEALTDIGAHREGNRGRSKSRIGGYFAVAVALHAIAYGFADDVHAGDGTAYEDCPVNGTAIYPVSVAVGKRQPDLAAAMRDAIQIGRASCRESVCQYV